MSSEESHPTPLRLAAYRLRKSSVARCHPLNLPHPLKIHHVALVALLVLSWVALNETYAIKLIFEQECLADNGRELGSRNHPSSSSRSWWAQCASAAAERIWLSTLSEGAASRLHLDVPRSPPAAGGSCRRILRLGHSSMFGERDGGWNVCGDDFARSKRLERKSLGRECVIYSFGINDDPSFDHDVVRRWPECGVYAFDPSIGRETGDAFFGSWDTVFQYWVRGLQYGGRFCG